MSREICFAVLCPNHRREKVKVTTNTSILQVLEEVCIKKSLNPADFDLCHNNKPLDLSLPIRFSNLPNNAQLELNPIKTLRVESTVTVGLQLESGERLMKDFTPSSSLQDVIEQCLSSRADEPMQVEAAGEPVCIYMRQKLIGDAIKSTTLRSLGLTKGKAIIRLLYRHPEELTEQAHQSAPLKKPVLESSSLSGNEQNSAPLDAAAQPSKQPRLEFESSESSQTVAPLHQEDAEPESINDHFDSLCNDKPSEKEPLVSPSGSSADKYEATCTSSVIVKETQHASSEDDVMETNALEEVEEIGEIIYIGDRHAVLYNLEDITDVKRADLPDEFFELTIDDVKYLMEGYRRERIGMENQPLMIGAQRQKNLLQHLNHYRKTIIRVYFPERLVLQAVFRVDETVQSVMDFMRNFLQERDIKFYLYITPPKEKLCASKTLLEVSLVPAANVYFGCESHYSCYLMNELKSKTSDPRAAAIAASNARKESYCDTPSDTPMTTVESRISAANVPEPQPMTNADQIQQARSEMRTTPGKVPKWLKLSK